MRSIRGSGARRGLAGGGLLAAARSGGTALGHSGRGRLRGPLATDPTVPFAPEQLSSKIKVAWDLGDLDVTTVAPFIDNSGVSSNLTANGSPGTTTFNGRTVADLDGTDDYFGSTANFGTSRWVLIIARCDLTTFGSEGLLTAPAGGADETALIGNPGTARFYPLSAFRRNVEVNSGDWSSNLDYLPNGANLVAIYARFDGSAEFNAAGGIHIGRDRGFDDRYWDGQIARVYIGHAGVGMELSTGELQRLVAHEAQRYGFAADIHASNEWAQADTITAIPSSAGQALLDESLHLSFQNVRTGARGSGFDGAADSSANTTDRRTYSGLEFLSAHGPLTLRCDSTLDTWTASGSVVVSEPETGVYRLTITGAATLSDAMSSSSTASGACQMRVTSGAIPESSRFGLTNAGADIGTADPIVGLGGEWTSVDCFAATTHDGIQFSFPAGTNCVLEVRRMRCYAGATSRLPPAAHGAVAGAAIGIDSQSASIPWLTGQTLVTIAVPYGYSGAAGPATSSGVLWSAGSGWRAVNPGGPQFVGSGGSPTTESIAEAVADGEPLAVAFAWDGSNISARAEDGVAVTAAETDIPSSTIYSGSYSAANAFCGFICLLPFARTLSDAEIDTLAEHVHSLLPDFSEIAA